METALKEYRLKRNFRQTSEPAGSAKQRPGKSGGADGGIFIVHKHDARRLHYDLRLEHKGVLWSWAVTRGPSLDPTEKRLSVHVENHPLEYAEFEGSIPKGSYGAGTVIVWDEGTWTPLEDAAKGMKKGHLNFELHGKKLKGGWHLVRMKPRTGEKHDNWLLIKANDAFARPGEDILENEPHSVKSKTKISEAAVAKKRPAEKPKKQSAGKKIRRLSSLPDFIPPALATLKSAPPSGKEWLHEVKFDGYRIQAHVANGKVKLLTRSGLDWTGRFGDGIVAALAGLNCTQAIIDGEIVVLSETGVASFARLQADLSDSRSDRMLFYTFDLLHLNDESCGDEPTVERKARLAELLKNQKADSPLSYSDHFVEPGEVMLAHACRMGLEGIISKRADVSYSSGRTPDWIKSKCTLRQEFIIIGYLPSAATGRGLRSILVAYQENGKLKYGGRVGTGFSQKSGDDLKRKLDRLKLKASPVPGLEKMEKSAIWVKPELVAEVEFRTWTDAGVLRQAAYLGLREDKPAQEVKKEMPDEPSSQPKTSARKATVSLTNANKLLWPDAKISKQDLFAYYGTVWPRMEAFVVERPLSLLRAPDGIGGQRFFQKHASPGMHEAISTMRDAEDHQELIYIRNFDGMAALVQLGAVEVHIWGAKIEAIETPDQIVFDLDPDEGLGEQAVRDATLAVKLKLDELGLPALVKTSGGKGFHIVVPLKPKAQWAEVKTFAHDFAHAMAQSDPGLYTATLSKKARKGRIFIDYLRNGKGSTTVAPYSLRANENAAISMPIGWSLLKKNISPKAFLINGAETGKALRQADPWAQFFKIGKSLRQ
jgi:bifunctional non-homologous end joining protein LigD